YMLVVEEQSRGLQLMVGPVGFGAIDENQRLCGRVLPRVVKSSIRGSEEGPVRCATAQQQDQHNQQRAAHARTSFRDVATSIAAGRHASPPVKSVVTVSRGADRSG